MLTKYAEPLYKLKTKLTLNREVTAYGQSTVLNTNNVSRKVLQSSLEIIIAIVKAHSSTSRNLNIKPNRQQTSRCITRGPWTRWTQLMDPRGHHSTDHSANPSAALNPRLLQRNRKTDGFAGMTVGCWDSFDI